MKDNSPRVAFDFRGSPREKISEVESGVAPRESLLGFFQLRDNGWQVVASDTRWRGRLGSVWLRLQRFIEIPDMGTLRDWWQADVIVITTRLSVPLALSAKMLGKPVVFLDALQSVPRRYWRRLGARAALWLADDVIIYSAAQGREWAQKLRLRADRFHAIPYGIDCDFCRLPIRSEQDELSDQRDYVLSVGRDPERDFVTLAHATANAGVDLQLVTLPYLVPQEVRDMRHVIVHERLSYEKLFTLYRDARAAVVPVRRNVSYMAGIRAVMEAMALGVPVIATRTAGLEEYFDDKTHLLFVEPGDKVGLQSSIARLIDFPDEPHRMVGTASTLVRDKYSAERTISALEKRLYSALGREIDANG